MVDSEAFFERAPWKKKAQAAQAFMQRHMEDNLVMLELGVGPRNQMIRTPLQQAAALSPDALYVIVNKEPAYVPPEIAARIAQIDEDIARVLHELRSA